MFQSSRPRVRSFSARAGDIGSPPQRIFRSSGSSHPESISLCQPLGTSKTTSDRWKKIEYLQVKLGTVHITRVHLVGDPALHYFGRATNFPIVAGSVLEMGPIEEIDLTYQTIEWLYKGGTGALNISGKWNLQTNSAT